MIQAIIFDCFGVLTEDSWHTFRTLLPQEQQQQAQDLMHAYSSGFLGQVEFVNQVAATTGVKAKEILDKLQHETGKNHQLLSYIRELKKRGLKVGLLSNIANNWVRDTFLTPDEQELFDQMVFSYEVGMTKPDPRIFELTCKQLDVEPNQAVMVDDIDTYCVAARQVGMQAIVYSEFRQLQAELEQILDHA